MELEPFYLLAECKSCKSPCKCRCFPRKTAAIQMKAPERAISAEQSLQNLPAADGRSNIHGSINHLGGWTCSCPKIISYYVLVSRT